MAKYYAWSPIDTVDGRLPAGTEVTAAKLKIGNTEWDQLVESGSVRLRPYPALPAGYLGSPKDYRRQELIKNLGGLEDLGLEVDEEGE